MREHPLATVITTDDTGFPYIAHLPLHLEVDTSGKPSMLLGHCARGNPLRDYLKQRPLALVSFMGPHAYLSPSVYTDKQRVPTWSYVAVQARVAATVFSDDDLFALFLKFLYTILSHRIFFLKFANKHFTPGNDV
eukprot:TRINITY_DN8425_c0_g1_i1.p1 TRINITY_DN8425_c0_g1~~TRINITY_DN8425_c0_g1_i1.p1  ORF type:complete len:135 (-),score=16.34 TRINITY_DN8425_c0_g1_i1:23-427(-)